MWRHHEVEALELDRLERHSTSALDENPGAGSFA